MLTEERYEQLKATTKQPIPYNYRGWLIIEGNLMTELTVDAHVFVSGNIYAPLRSTGRVVCDGKVEAEGSIIEYFKPNMIEFSTKYLENFDLLITNGTLRFSDNITKDERTGSLFTQGIVDQGVLDEKPLDDIGAVVLNKNLTIVSDVYCALNVEHSNIFEVNDNIKLTAISISKNKSGVAVMSNGIFMIYPDAVVEANGNNGSCGFVNVSDGMCIVKGNLIAYGKTGINNNGIMLNYHNVKAIGTESGILNKGCAAKFTVGMRGVVNTFGCTYGFNNYTTGRWEDCKDKNGVVVSEWCPGGLLIVEEGGIINCVGPFRNRGERFYDGRTHVNGTISITGIGIDNEDEFTTTTTKGKGKVYINDVLVYNSKFPIEDVDKWVN